MLTDMMRVLRSLSGLVAALAVVGVAALALVSTSGAATIPTPTLPADMDRLGLTIAAPVGQSAVSEAEAIAAVRGQVGEEGDGTALLLSVTDPHSVGTAYEIAARDVWVVRISGVSLWFPEPAREDGTEGAGNTAHFIYAFVDPQTGAVIDLQYWG